MPDVIDFNEYRVTKLYPELMDILLYDFTSKKNIKWCTDNYKRAGIKADDHMEKGCLIYRKDSLIKPRVLKSQTEQKKRSKDMAEVFTPSWICNKQNNLIDNEWFGYEGAFNKEEGNSWITSTKVVFNDDKTWQDYVDLERLEITCGEAPYLTSRYDTTNGKYIEPLDRIGLLDRKLRVITENVDDKEDWIKWSIIAYKRIYGFEYQGDNLLIARENLLMTFIEFYKIKFNEEPNIDTLKEIATIISWNIWQMDGLKYVIPNSCHFEEMIQMSLFEEFQEEPEFCEGCKTGNNHRHNGIYCKIKDWKKNKTIRFIDLMR